MWNVREVVSVSYMGIIGVIGVILNLLLLRAVYRSTPPTMKVYSILIVNTAIVDIIASISTIIAIPREQSTSFGIVIFFYGVGSTIDFRLCWICFASLVYSLVMSHYLLFSSFVFRSYVITGNSMNMKKLYSALIPLNMINLFVFIGVLNELFHTDLSILRSIPHHRIDFDITTVSIGIFDITQRTTSLITLIFVLSTSPVLFIFCFFMKNRIINELEKRRFLLSKNSHQLHKMLLDSLRVQLLATSLLSIGASIFIATYFDLFYSPWMDFVQPAIVSTIVIVSPITNLFYIQPYRRSVSTLIRRQCAVEGTSSAYSRTSSI